MFKEIKNYVLEQELEIIYKKDAVIIVNYLSIDHFENEKIIIKCKNKIVVIKGKDLRINKLLKDEVLIRGQFTNIELR